MVVLAVSAAWVGVVGTAIGGAIGAVLGFLGSWYLGREERKAKVNERSRSEKKEAYAAWLSSADDTMHRFQWLAEGLISSDGREEDRKTAVRYYDEQLVPKQNVLKLIGEDDVVEAGGVMRRALGEIRRPMKTEPTEKSREFKDAHRHYRDARKEFIKLARADLDRTDAGARAARTP